MHSQPTILGLIPARGGSKGVPGKNLRLLAGKPLIRYTVEAAQQSRRLDRIVLSTDSPAIMAACVGAEILFRRPQHLATDTTPTAPVVAHVLQWLREHQAYVPDVVVLLQPTSPLRSASDIDSCIDLLLETGRDSVVSLCEAPRHYHPSWQFSLDARGALRAYDGAPLTQIPPRRQALPPTYSRNGAVYAFRTSLFADTGSFYSESTLGYVMPTERSANIDSLEDWHEAERRIADLQRAEHSEGIHAKAS